MNFIGEMDLRDSQRFNNYHRVNLSHVGVIGVIENGWISDRYQVIRYQGPHDVYYGFYNLKWNCYDDPSEMTDVYDQMFEVGSSHRYMVDDTTLAAWFVPGAEEYVEGCWIAKSSKYRVKAKMAGPKGDALKEACQKNLVRIFDALKLAKTW